jgi:hypothetical protein
MTAPAVAAFAGGGVGFVVGTIFGALALSKKSSLNSVCQDKVCPASEQPTINTMLTDATVSTIGLVVGVVGLGAGITLFATSGGSSSSQAGVRVEPRIGLGTMGLGGTFQ